jgi:hypothetical protein
MDWDWWADFVTKVIVFGGLVVAAVMVLQWVCRHLGG